jgi:hypothetical protein
VIGRELLIFVLAVGAFSSGVAAYLFVFHGEASMKEIRASTAAAMIGMYFGRFVQKGLTRG